VERDEKRLRIEPRRREGTRTRVLEMDMPVLKLKDLIEYSIGLQEVGPPLPHDLQRRADSHFQREPCMIECVAALDLIQDSRIFTKEDCKAGIAKYGHNSNQSN
jgi:hypothetical protein